MRILLVGEKTDGLKQVLVKRGFIVDAAKTADEADRKARAVDYGAVVVNFENPKRKSWSVLKRWRDNGVDTHVIVVVAAGTLQHRLDAFSVGADDCLTRPFANEELIARLRAVAGREPPDRHTLIIGDLEIDTATRKVQRAGRTISLTAREFDLLHYLAQHRGKPVTRAKIREHLYDVDEPHRSNVVDVYIRYLRRKIDTGHDQPLIATRRGQGYMLIDPDA